jgi:hypothetical protein
MMLARTIESALQYNSDYYTSMTARDRVYVLKHYAGSVVARGECYTTYWGLRRCRLTPQANQCLQRDGLHALR